MTERIVRSTKPRFQVDGLDVDRLAADLLRLEVWHDEDGMGRLEMRLSNWGQLNQGDPTGFIYFGGDLMDLGRELVVEAGDAEAAGIIFRGHVTSIQGVFPEVSAPELVVCAEDELQQLRMRTSTRLFEDSTDRDIAATVADDHGLSTEGDPDGPTHVQLMQINQSDLSFIRERAWAVDARPQIIDGALNFLPKRDDEDTDPPELSRLKELVDFRVRVDLAHQRTEVQVHGYSVADKEAIIATATKDDLSAENLDGGRTGPEVLEDLDWTAVDHRHIEVPSTQEEADHLAKAILKERARNFVHGEGTTKGTPTMRIGQVLQLNDLGDWFSGKYYVSSLRHSWDGRVGMRTYFEAQRVDLGEAG